MSTLLGEDCGLDIYEEPSESKWVECKMLEARIGMYVIVPVLILFTLLFMWLGTGGWKVAAGVVGTFLVVSVVASALFWTPRAARVEHRRFQRELQSYMTDGKSRADAIAAIKTERLAREKIAAIRGNSNSNNSIGTHAVSFGLGTLTGALASRK